MVVEKTERGFETIRRASCPDEEVLMLVQQSSVIGNYSHSMSNPGSSALWIGSNHLLYKEQVTELISHLQAWVETGSLELQQTGGKS